MKITDKILSLPPYISTAWKNIVSIHVETRPYGHVLLIELITGTKVEVPHLDPKLMEKIGGVPGLGDLLSHGFDNFWKPELQAWLSNKAYPGTLSDAEINTLSNDPPLLFFILFEAAKESQGVQLGTLGSIIVADVFFGALEADKMAIERGHTTLQGALRELGGQILARDDAFEFVPEIRSMPELIAFMVDELKVGDTPPAFI